MASIHRRPDSKYYHAAFRGPDGKLVLRSTKRTERSAALAIALEFERAAQLAKRGELVEAQARRVLQGIMERANLGESIQNVTIRKHFTDWLAGKEVRRAESTSVRYSTVIALFLSALGPRADKNLTALTAQDVEAFLNSRLGMGLASRTAVLDVKIIRTALNDARRKGLIPANPAEAIELPDVEGVERGVFTPTEVGLLVEAATGEWKTLILVAYFIGARLTDCCNLSWKNIDLVSCSLTFRQGKTGKMLTVPIHQDLQEHLELLATSDCPGDFVMPHMAELKSGGRHGLSEGFKRIMVKAGLDMQPVDGPGLRKLNRRTFHALRHSFTSGLANAGVSPEMRMKLTGHKSVKVHSGYTHHEFEVLRKELKKLPGIKKTEVTLPQTSRPSD